MTGLPISKLPRGECGPRKPLLSPTFAKRWCKCRADAKRKYDIFCNCGQKKDFFPFSRFFSPAAFVHSRFLRSFALAKIFTQIHFAISEALHLSISFERCAPPRPQAVMAAGVLSKTLATGSGAPFFCPFTQKKNQRLMAMLKETENFLWDFRMELLPWMEKCFENFTSGWELRCDKGEIPEAEDFNYLWFWSELKKCIEEDLKGLDKE